MAKVYVSSTIADLKPERQAVLDWLRQARHQAVDSYLPDSDTVKESCLDDVTASDLYVLILGHRYGFQPPLDNAGGLSITHLEFRRAGESGIPRIALLRTGIPDVSLSDLADPQRLALVSAFREEVAREVRPAEFNDLRGLIQGLSTGIQGELDKRDQRDGRPGGQAVARRALRLAMRPPFLAGREGLLAELEDRLGVDGGAGPRVVALCGLGGAGKTSVALEYAHRHLDEVGVVWQFPAEDPAVLPAWFGELAAQLGVQDLLETADPVALVHGVLAAHRAEWLLIFDNGTDRKAVERFLPPAGRGRVLVTSRSALWPPGQALEVPVLDAEVAADYLVRLTGDPDRQAALELAGELGGLPLALEQAAAYIQASASSLARYLVLLRQRRPDLLARGEPAGSGQTVATTWSLAFTQLERSAAAAAGLLRLLACLAPEPVPLELLFADAQAASEFVPEVAATVGPLLGDMVAVGDAVAALRRYSLVSPAGDGLVQVHRLVQAVTADQMPGELAEAWRQAAADLIEAAIPDDTALPEAWPACAALLPHAQVALADNSAGMARIVKYVGSRGSYAAARDLQQRVLDARERVLGPEDPDTLAARGDLALWTGEAGDPAAARDQYARLLPVLEEALGPEHPRTLDARHELASWTGGAGDATAARDQFAALLPVRERVLGSEHLDSLATRHELAGWTGEAGDPAAARDLLAKLFPWEELRLGPKHPYTLWGRSDLARFTGLAGDAAAARDQFAALLQLREQVLGLEHPRTLITRSDLARWTGEAGDPAAARDRYAALLPVRERVLGPEHPDTLVTRHELARWTGEAGDPAAARDQYAALVPIRERVSGDEQPDTLATRFNLAMWTGEAGDAAAARDLFAALQPVREKILGAGHPDTLSARDALACWTGEAGDAAAARDLLAALLPVRERVSGDEHPDTLTTRAQLAAWTGQAGDPAAARDLLAALLPVRERVSGDEHPETLIARGSLARWTGEAGDAAAARDLFAALLPARERVQGPEHPYTLAARENLARWTGEAGDAAAARDQYAALLPLRERVSGPDHPDTQAARGDLARWTSSAAGDPSAA